MPNLPRNPHVLFRDAQANNEPWESEFGFGAGMFPDPRIDFSGGGSISGFPIADPDRTQQLRELAAMKRTDLGESGESDPANPYVAGNPDRYGAAPPLVRETRVPKPSKRTPPVRARMVREW